MLSLGRRQWQGRCSAPQSVVPFKSSGYADFGLRLVNKRATGSRISVTWVFLQTLTTPGSSACVARMLRTQRRRAAVDTERADGVSLMAHRAPGGRSSAKAGIAGRKPVKNGFRTTENQAAVALRLTQRPVHHRRSDHREHPDVAKTPPWSR